MAVDQRDWPAVTRLLAAWPPSAPGAVPGPQAIRLTGCEPCEIEGFVAALPEQAQVPVVILDGCQLLGIHPSLHKLTAHPRLQGLRIENCELAPIDGIDQLLGVWISLAAGAEQRHHAGHAGLQELGWTGTSVGLPPDGGHPLDDGDQALLASQGLADLIRFSPDLRVLRLSGSLGQNVFLDVMDAIRHLPAAASLSHLVLDRCEPACFASEPTGPDAWRSSGGSLTHIELCNWNWSGWMRPQGTDDSPSVSNLLEVLQPALLAAPAGLQLDVRDMHEAPDLGWLLANILVRRCASIDIIWTASVESDRSYFRFCQALGDPDEVMAIDWASIQIDLSLQGPGSGPARAVYGLTARILQDRSTGVRAFNSATESFEVRRPSMAMQSGQLRFDVDPEHGLEPDRLTPARRLDLQRLVTSQQAMAVGFWLHDRCHVPSDIAIQLHRHMVAIPDSDPGQDTLSFLSTSTHSYRSWTVAHERARALERPGTRLLTGPWVHLSPTPEQDPET